MNLIVQENNLVKLKDIKYGQVFKPQCYTGHTAGDYFVKIKSNDGVSLKARPEYLSLKDFNTHPLNENTLAYLMDADIVIKDIIVNETEGLSFKQDLRNRGLI